MAVGQRSLQRKNVLYLTSLLMVRAMDISQYLPNSVLCHTHPCCRQVPSHKLTTIGRACLVMRKQQPGYFFIQNIKRVQQQAVGYIQPRSFCITQPLMKLQLACRDFSTMDRPWRASRPRQRTSRVGQIAPQFTQIISRDPFLTFIIQVLHLAYCS